MDIDLQDPCRPDPHNGWLKIDDEYDVVITTRNKRECEIF